MKKFIALFLALVMVLGISACGGNTETTTANTPATTTQKPAETTTSVPAPTETTTEKPAETTTTIVDPSFCSHNYKETETIPAGYLQDETIVSVCSLCGMEKYDIGEKGIDSIKILAVGNSFSVDAMEYLWEICTDAGFKEVILGNLYIGGCTLDTHWSNIASNSAAYTYYYNDNGIWQTNNKVTLDSALTAEAWDVITIQQGSPLSGMANSYGKLADIVAHLDAKKTNADAKIYWHMTWAYQNNTSPSGFENYGKDQATMYNAIIDTVQNTVLSTEGIDGIIPSGTAVQNLRTSYIGDKLTRDGYHLKYDIGRYLAGLTWFAKLTGISASTLTETPALFYRDLYIHTPVLTEAADAAVKAPYEVTTCVKTERELVSETRELSEEEKTYLTSLGYDPASYLVLELELTPFAQYSANGAAQIKYEGNSAGLATLSLFHTTRIFEKKEIPNGSLITVESGYLYFPHGWVDVTTGGAKTKRTNETVTIVDDAWWGDYQFRAFDFAHEDLKTDMTLDEMDVFCIFVPKT